MPACDRRHGYNARMDLALFERLRGPEGQALLSAAESLSPTEANQLPVIEALKRMTDPALARAVLETVLLRQRARTKFTRADRMYFEREALEQASGERIARHRAERYRGAASVADLCVGLGGDAIGLASVAPTVVVDRDPLRVALASANLRAYDLRGDAILRDLEVDGPPAAAALWCDPGRRAGGRRLHRVADYQPPLPLVASWSERTPALGIKLSPGVDLDELHAIEAEREFISVEGELKECVLWFGPLATTRWRATVMGQESSDSLWGEHHDTHHLSAAPASTRPVGRVLYEPDAAVIRAGQVRALADRLGAHLIDPTIAYLSADDAVMTPFARAFDVEAVLPFHLKRLRQLLVERGIGRVTVKKRGSPIEPEDLIRRLHLNGDGPEAVVLLTRQAGEHVAIVAKPRGRGSLGTGSAGASARGSDL